MNTKQRSPAATVILLLAMVAWWAPALAQAEIRIEKATDAQDADAPPGPALAVGDPVTWTYQVTNVGSRELIEIEVTDDVEGAVTCPATSLTPGESMTCTLVGTVQSGQYANVGTATGLLPNEDPVMDTDPSHYFGILEVALTLEKSTEGFDADTPPGPALSVGSTVDWAYEVTNVGSEPLTDVEVTDDQGMTVTCPGTTLAVGESMICIASGTVMSGQYSNLGTATANLPDETPVVASDPSHYFGQSLVLEKRTEGQDADFPPGPSLQAGDVVTWTYEVSNPGPETVTNLAVTDDQGVAVTCPQTTLAPRESVTCTDSGTVQFGLYANIGTATAELPQGGVVSDSDPSHYTGPLLRLEKRTNGEDADAPPGPSILVGSAVNWTYELTNFSESTLTEVSVSDDQGVTVSCPANTLDPGETMTCTAAGTAQSGQYANLGTATGELPEDLTLTATDPSHYFGTPFEFGDAPDPGYPTLLASNGARHRPGNVFLGACIDYEFDGQPTTAADGDDSAAGQTTTGTCATAGDDEDGVVFSTPLVIGGTAEIEITASAACTLSAWIDFDQNGDWSDAAEELFPGGQVLAAGANSLSFPVPAGAGEGDTYARFRCTTDGEVPPTGEATDGEVEDYSVFIETPVPDVAASKTDALEIDVDNDGQAEPGDTLRYTVTVSNDGTGDATQVLFTDTPDANTALVAGSVMTTAGTVTTGNSGGDTSVAVDLGTIDGLGGTAEITFDVVIDDPLELGVTSVANQGVVAGSNIDDVPTDDPDVAGTADPTVTQLTPPPAISATKTDALEVDVDNDGQAEPGDTLRYTVTVTNEGTGDAAAVVFTDTPDANTALVTGSVTTTTGTVTTGNSGGDTSVAVDLGTIDGLGGTEVITFDVVIDDPLELGVTSVANQGVVSGSNIDDVPTDDPDVAGTADPTVTQLTPPPAISATKTDALEVDVDNDGQAESGDTLRYTVTVTNEGTGDATAVVFTDTPDANTALVAGSVMTTAGTVTTGNSGGDTSVAVDLGTIDGLGGTEEITFDVVIDDPLELGVTSVANQGVVAAANFDDVPTDDPDVAGTADPTVTQLTVPPDLAASKTDALEVDVDNDGQPEPGDTLRYTVTVTNAGTGDATEVVFTDTPDANTALVAGSVTTTAGTVTTGNTGGDTSVAVDLGTLDGLGGTAEITFDVVIDDPLEVGVTSVANQGVIAAANFDDVPTDDPDVAGTADPTVTQLTAPPAISATKTDALEVDVDNDGQVEPGDTLRYTVTVTNDGTGDATDVVFTDTPDANTALVAGSVTTTAGTVTSGNSGGDTSVAVDLGTIDGLGGTAEITFDVVIDDPVPAGVSSVSNQGLVSGDNFADVLTDDPEVAGTEDPTVAMFDAAPVVSASKTATLVVDVDGDGRADAGDEIRYTIVVENTGNADAGEVVLSDTPDPNTNILAGSVSTTQGVIISGNAAGDAVVTVELGTLPGIDGTATIVFDVRVANHLSLDVTSIVNSATITGSNFAATTSDDPSQPGTNDPTVTGVSHFVLPIPTLDRWMLFVLIGLLALAGLRRITAETAGGGI